MSDHKNHTKDLSAHIIEGAAKETGKYVGDTAGTVIGTVIGSAIGMPFLGAAFGWAGGRIYGSWYKDIAKKEITEGGGEEGLSENSFFYGW
jgi:uncharacterized membrane protein